MAANLPTQPALEPRTVLEAQRDGVCLECGRPGTPWQGDTVPYCRRCKREQTARLAGHPERIGG